MIAETYIELLKNWPHWAFELTVEVATFIGMTMPIRWWVKRHDAAKHHKCCEHCGRELGN